MVTRGDIELLEFDDRSAGVRLTGMCAGAYDPLVGIESALRDEIPDFETLRLL